MQENRPARPGRQQVDQQALAAALAQNAKMSGQMGNIYAGSRMTSGPTGQRFISANPQSQQGMMPMMSEATQRAYERTLRQQSQAARQTEMDKRYAEYKAGNPDPWGEGKPWATKEQWDTERRQAGLGGFDWSRDDNTPENVASQMAQIKFLQSRVPGYQPPEAMANALSKYQLDPAYNNFQSWGEQDYKNAGYTLQNPTDLQKKFGVTEQQWVKATQSAAPPQTPQAPTQAAPSAAPGLGGGGMQPAAQSTTGKPGQKLPSTGKGGQPLPRP